MIKKILIKIKYSLWLRPAVITLLSLLLAVICGLLDSGRWLRLDQILPAFTLTGIDLAHTILGVTSAATLSMTVFTFSTTMVVLTTYSSQYSPRVVRNFLTDDETLKTLGIFMGGFVYSIMALSFMKSALGSQLVVSANIGIIFIVACLIQFLKYVSHVSSFIQVKNLIQRLYDDAEICIGKYREFLEDGRIDERFELPQSEQVIELKAETSGYIRLIDYRGLIRTANQLDCFIQLTKITGVFITRDTILLEIRHNHENFAEKAKQFLQYITIGNEPLQDQDFLFSVQKISEITLRSISPGINDPNTAIHCLKITGVLLSELADLEHGWLLVRKGNQQSDMTSPLVCAFELVDFEKIIYFTYYQIVHYGRQDISVMLAFIKSLGFVMKRSSYRNRQHISIFIDYVWAKLPDDLKRGHDHQLLEKEKAECLETIRP